MYEQIDFETITMDEYKTMKNFEITYGIVTSKFGQCLLATHNDKICYMSLFDEGKDNSAIDILQQDWPNAKLTENTKMISDFASSVFERKKPLTDEESKLNVLLRGTELQCKVWKELTKLKEGSTTSYQMLAKAVGNPKAIRAVASAISRNKIAYLIPCHRVIRKTGAPNKYKWGPERKVRILKYESEL